MKIAVITGATSGMGWRMAENLNDYIPNIEEFWLIGRRTERLEQLSQRLTRRSRLFSLDLGRSESLTVYETALQQKKPEIVFLVNAAGFGKIGSVADLSTADQGGIVDVNVRALTLLCKISIPYLAKKSRIINFASAAAFLPQPDFAVYAASKSYVLSFSRALGRELSGTGTRVTAVCPGPVRTEFFSLAETTGKIPSYKHLFMANPNRVVRKALIDSVHGRELSVYGLSMNLLLLITKILPVRLILWCEMRLNHTGK